ncbi:hypothetical protein L596_009254 [Steinernema carpocapsae]|uniref:Uncharacterized protein n=1 Tax=Steinernema carpocapsae TaxID=34508 RepID=A0A4U5PFL7_STECR|nr:hypothetical protein L596_009254 [Steinernema carpocapsae]
MKRRDPLGSMESAHRLSTSTPSWATWDCWERCVGIRKTMGSDVIEQRFSKFLLGIAFADDVLLVFDGDGEDGLDAEGAYQHSPEPEPASFTYFKNRGS